MKLSRLRSNLWLRRFKTYVYAALLLTVGYQLAWHQEAFNGHPGRAFVVLVTFGLGIAIVAAALKTTHRAWISVGLVVCLMAGAYGSSLLHGVKWSSLWIVGGLVGLVILTEVVVRDSLPSRLAWLKRKGSKSTLSSGSKRVPWFVPRIHFGQRPPRESVPNDPALLFDDDHDRTYEYGQHD